METQVNISTAARIIAKCGGHKATADLAGVKKHYVYRWTYSKDRGGLGGRVPENARRALLRAALAGKVNLTPVDFEEGWAPAISGTHCAQTEINPASILLEGGSLEPRT